jgi:autonomous glycyl radical cofactor GrcA
LQDRFEVPDPVTLVGVRVHVRVLGGLTLDVNVIAALKPFRADRVMVDDPAAPALTVTLVGFAVIVKSWTV